MNEIKTWNIFANFVIYFILFIVGASIAAVPRFIVGFENETGILVCISELLRIPITIILLYWFTKYVVKLPLNLPTLSFKHLNIGLWTLLGLSLPIITVLIFYITNNLKVESINNDISKTYFFDILIKAFGVSLASGFVEEIIFRGYLFNLLKRKYNFWIAALIPSFLFTLIHLGGADSFLNIIQLLIAGMLVSFMFVMIYRYTKSIWNAGIVHFLWNFLLLNGLIVFNAKDNPEYWIQLNIGNNELFNGGNFGIETSVPAIMVYCITCFILWRLIRQKENHSGKNVIIDSE
jgi:hypothetical protein